ncbi:hypothetical protein IFM89_003396, partial [Coptis chinensis]
IEFNYRELEVEKHVQYIFSVEKVLLYCNMHSHYCIDWMKLTLRSPHLVGGFGCTPGGESHAGQTSLCIVIPSLSCGDSFVFVQVSYSWWVLSSLILIDRIHWIDKGKLAKFILDSEVATDISLY